MKKILAALLFTVSSVASANIYDTVTLVDDDGEYALYQTHDENFFFMHARNDGFFVSMSIPTMAAKGKAGYAIIPANDLQEMSDNAYQAQVYTADCTHDTIKDERGRIHQVQYLTDLHQTAFATSCHLFAQI